MKKVLLLTVLVFFLTAGNLLAADKIAIINMKIILQKSLAGQEATKEFQKIFDKTRAKIEAEEKKLQQLKETLEKQRLILTEEALKEKEIEYEKQYRDYKRLVEDSNNDMQRTNTEMSQKMIPEVLKIVAEIGKSGGYLAIWDADSPGLAYHAPQIDLSDKVIAEYDKVYKKK